MPTTTDESRVRAILGRVHHYCLQIIGDEACDCVDVLGAARAKAQMVQAGGVLVEGRGSLIGGCTLNQDPGAAADTIDRVFVAQQGVHLQEMTQLFPKWKATPGVVYG